MCIFLHSQHFLSQRCLLATLILEPSEHLCRDWRASLGHPGSSSSRGNPERRCVPLPALPSLGITQFFLVIRKGDWEGLFLWKIMIFVRRYLPVVAKGLLLRKELWSHISLRICNIWASSQPWLCCRHTYASSFPALGASSRNSRVGMSFLSLSLWHAEGHELPDDPHPCPTSHSLWEEAWVLLCLSSVNIN